MDINNWKKERLHKVRQIRKIAGVKSRLSWAQLCHRTEFDSFTTCFAFGFNWNNNCPNDRLLTMTDVYLNMILFNLTNFHKEQPHD